MTVNNNSKLKRKLVVIAGPTAVGKTKFAIKCASALDGEIINCDSMQLYKYMDIGSAKPTKEERSQIKHYLVDEIDPGENFSVAKYQSISKTYIEKIFSKNKLPIISGGTGLYLNSLLYDMDFSTPNIDEGFRNEMFHLAEKNGVLAVYDKLLALDPKAADRIHPNNLKKVIRALEAARQGDNIKDFATEPLKTKDYTPIMICLDRNREDLYDRINRRVDILIEQGLVDEVKALLANGLTENNISMKGIGYKEIIDYINGEYDLDEGIRLIKRNSRHLAKRQLTWFKRYKDMKWFNISEYNTDEDCIKEIILWLQKQLKN